MPDESPLRRSVASRVPAADVDDVIEIAARRQDEAHEAARGATRAELEAVAKELEIAPEHVEAAIGELHERRAAEAARLEAAKGEEAARGKTVRLALLGVATAIAFAVFGAVGLAWSASGAIDAAAGDTKAAEARVVAVLERQAALAPQLTALAGGDAGALTGLGEKVRAGATLEERLAASAELSTAMATQIAALPPPATDAEATLRLQLSDEVAGSQNRVTTELRRYREAEAAWRTAADQGFGGVAVSLGFADAPP